MAPNVNVILLKNSGYNGLNIPDSIGTALKAQQLATTAIFKRQAENLLSIKVEITDNIADLVDYAILTKDGINYCYFVTSYAMTSPKTCVLSIQMDALTTINALSNGGSSSIKGWLKRKNKSDAEIQNKDLASKQKLSEPWQPETEKVDDYYSQVLGATSQNNDWYVLSTVDLGNLSHKAEKYIVDESGHNSVTVPKLPYVPEATVFSIGNYGKGWKIPFSAIYDGTDSTVKASVNDCRSLGVESAISASYTVPGIYSSNSGGPLMSSVKGTLATKSTGISADIPGVQVENLKAMYFHQNVKLMSMCSGDEKDFTVSQIGVDFVLTYYADPHPDGKPYCRFQTINGNSDNILLGAVKGSKWQNQALGWTQRSASAQAEHQYNRTAGMNSFQMARNIVRDGGTALATKNLGGMADAVLNGIQQGMSLYNNKKVFEEQQQLVSPEIKFVASDNMQNYVGNDFAIQRTRLSENDIHRFDTFLHQFGESVDMPFDIEDVYTRRNFNFVQCEKVTIKTDFPRYVSELATKQIESGVRVWHTNPSMAALEIGGN